MSLPGQLALGMAAMGSHLREAHPRYLDQVRKVAALRRHLLAPGDATPALRMARALQEYYAARYDVNHPKLREITAQVTALEKSPE